MSNLRTIANSRLVDGEKLDNLPNNSLGTFLQDAPVDGKQYARKNSTWDEVVLTGNINWTDIINKPLTFTPSAHTHTKSDITDFPTIPTKTSDLTNDSGFLTSSPVISVAWKTWAVTLVPWDVWLWNVDNTSDLNKPISSLTQTALNNKITGTQTVVTTLGTDHTTIPTSKAVADAMVSAGLGDMLASNNLSDVADITTARTNLDVYSKSEVTSSLSGKANSSHTHTASQITDLQTVLDSKIEADSTDTFTNKTLDDYTNFIHADGIHLRVKATEPLVKWDVIMFVWFNAWEQAIEVERRSNLNVPSIWVIYTASIAAGDFGMAVSNGLFKGINTSAFAEWTILYPDDNWWFTDTNPWWYAQQMAYVVRSHAINWEIMINVWPVYSSAQPYTILYTDSSVNIWNVYSVDATDWPVTLTLNDWNSPWQILTVKKIDSSDNSVFVNNANIDWETSIEISMEWESYDLYWTGFNFIIK